MSLGNRINIITFGCAKNVYDSELLAGQMKNNGLKVVHEAGFLKDDILLVNTCGFIGDAKRESIDNILEYIELKRQGKLSKVIVVGCLSERYLNELKTEIPEVDAFYGLDYPARLLADFNLELNKNLIGERILSTPSHYAYLKISDGCDHKCSFCAIPLIKGKYKSQSEEELVTQAELLAKQGVKELIIIAQDSTFYGMDIYGKREIASLLEKLSAVSGIDWIRLQYAYPAGFPDNLLDIIRNNPKICNYIDIPFQHISDRMLKLMRRGMNKASTLALIERIRNKIPGVVLRSTLIVGHPVETEEDFDELVDFVKTVRFDRLGVFTYSHEEDTHSFSLVDNVPEKEKKRRMNKILRLQQNISAEKNQARIGTELKVIIDSHEGNMYIGRTEFDTPEVDNEVLISPGNRKLKVGAFYNVRIIGASPYDLSAELSGK